MRLERDVKDAVKRKLNERKGVFWYMPVQSGFGVKGIPDFVVCYRGTFLGIETKFGGNRLSKWQQIQRTKIEAADGRYVVINENNIDELDKVLNDISTE